MGTWGSMNQITKNGKSSCRWVLTPEEKGTSTVNFSLGFKCLRAGALRYHSKSAISKRARRSQVRSASHSDLRSRGGMVSGHLPAPNSTTCSIRFSQLKKGRGFATRAALGKSLCANRHYPKGLWEKARASINPSSRDAEPGSRAGAPRSRSPGLGSLPRSPSGLPFPTHPFSHLSVSLALRSGLS